MAKNSTTRREVWFYDLQLGLLADGGYHLYVAENSVDEDEGPAFYNQEILDECFSSIDDALLQLKHILKNST